MKKGIVLIPWFAYAHAGGDERTHRSGLGDAFFENLPVLSLFVIEQRVHVDGFVVLSDAGIDSDLAEERFHAEGASFVGNDGHDQLAEFRIAQQLRQQAHEDHGRGHFAAIGAFVEFLEMRVGYGFQRFGPHLARRHVSAELFAARLHIFDFCAVVGRTIERSIVQFVVGYGNAEARTEHLQLVFVQFFLLVGDVLAFARFAEAVAFDGLGKNDRGLSGVVDRGAECGVNFDGIVAAETHARELIVGKMLDHLQQARIGAEEVLAEIGSAFDEIFLILSVADFAQPPHQYSVAVVLDEAIPVGAPDAFDDIPSGAAENRLEFLNDFPVAAHRAVETLQVAVHDEDEVVEFFA